MAGNCKLATLLQKTKLYTKHREYNGLSLLLLEGQITLHLLWCSYVGIKTGSKNGYKLGSEIVSKVGSKTGSKYSVLAFLKCLDRSVLAFLKCMDGSVLVSLKCLDASVLAHHLRFPIQPAPTQPSLGVIGNIGFASSRTKKSL